MNPSFMAMMGGMFKKPGAKKVKHETSINGRAFAPGKGVQQKTGYEADAIVRAHLAKLTQECIDRNTFPCSDMVTEMREAQEMKT